MVQKYFFSLECLFRARIIEEKSDKTNNSIKIDLKHYLIYQLFFNYLLKNYRKIYLITAFVKTFVNFFLSYKITNKKVCLVENIIIVFRISEFYWFFFSFYLPEFKVLISCRSFLKLTTL